MVSKEKPNLWAENRKLAAENLRLTKGLEAIISYTDQTSIRSFGIIRQMVRKTLRQGKDQ
jgi:hypothetical protein